jgi:DNA-binding beta-propeller fold protein YncE
VRGRIDHLAIDPIWQRLFVAELGNNSLGVVDVDAGKLIHVIRELKEPQGVGFATSTDTIYVANGGDGSVRIFRGDDFSEVGIIQLDADADNVRVDPVTNRIVVGYGNGALAIIDQATRSKIGDVVLKGHPESFQIDGPSKRIFVNVPTAREIAVVDLGAGRLVGTWPVEGDDNFPMALDDGGRRILVVFRNPPRLVAYSSTDGSRQASTETCADADDLFVDAKRHRVYVSCGEGYLDVFDHDANAYRRAARVKTATGARTSLFVPELDRLFLAVRATETAEAAIWVYRPQP